MSDWNAHANGLVRLSRGTGNADIRVANASFGNSGLLAVAAVRLGRLGHIVAGEVLLNDDYYYPGSPYEGTERQVYCQELGHTIGLDHNRAGTLDGSPDDTCMNDGDLRFSSPNGHDAEQLWAQYTHYDRHNAIARERDGGARVVVTHATPASATITGIEPFRRLLRE